MIEFTEDETKLTTKEVESFYKQNFQGKTVIHPIIGEIKFSGKGLGKTRYKHKFKYLPILTKIDKIIELGTVRKNKQGEILTTNFKQRTDNALGFIYITSEVDYNKEYLKVTVEILKDNLGNWYYVFDLGPIEKYLEEYRHLDLVTDVSARRGSMSISNNIIKHNNKKVKYLNETEQPDPDNPKIGDVFWLGDSIRIEVIDIIKDKENETLDIIKKLDELLEE